MKVVEDKDAPDVIVGNFHFSETIVHALIDLGSTHSYLCTSIPSLGCNTPKYTLVVFNMFRVFCKYNLNF